MEQVHNWDINTMRQMQSELNKLNDILKENKELLNSESFEITESLKGLAGAKVMFKTISTALALQKDIDKCESLSSYINDLITKCYEPCEQEITSKVSQLMNY